LQPDIYIYEKLFVFEYCQLCVGFSSVELLLTMSSLVDRRHISLCTFIEAKP